MDLLTWSCLSLHRARLVQKRGPFCPEAWSVLSWNVVRFVLRRGPFCPETWSVSSGPFCPWSALSMHGRRFGPVLVDRFGPLYFIHF